MAYFELWTGLNGGFGGAEYNGTYEFKNEEEALEAAYRECVDEYESYGGYHGLTSLDEIYENMEDFNCENDEDCLEAYTEIMESWFNYYVREVPILSDKPQYI